MSELTNQCREKMEKCLNNLNDALNTLRTGRANASLLNNLKVDYYGEPTPVSQIAAIKVPEPKQLLIVPYDQGDIKSIVAAINTSDIGINPIVDGKQIRLNMPALTEDRRKELSKKAKVYSEEAKVAVRNVRRDYIDKIKKDDSFTEDTSKKAEEDIQKVTDEYCKKIDNALKTKTDEIMTL